MARQHVLRLQGILATLAASLLTSSCIQSEVAIFPLSGGVRIDLPDHTLECFNYAFPGVDVYTVKEIATKKGSIAYEIQEQGDSSEPLVVSAYKLSSGKYALGSEYEGGYIYFPITVLDNANWLSIGEYSSSAVSEISSKYAIGVRTNEYATEVAGPTDDVQAFISDLFTVGNWSPQFLCRAAP
jgi:hypothetical protein